MKLIEMRTLTDHKLNGLNEAIEITVLDEPGQGGACHEYSVSIPAAHALRKDDRLSCRISFQNGPPPKNSDQTAFLKKHCLPL